ncbi:murein biosynthesis integral membrane protein MurJ [Egicoccus halophilus]|uniref:Probable lipid II flippase MurJ n=1 Tax=Egicoccus halophilus TaxID=1670830 RepID=A0A8J3AC45_9ACTN|nr:murein biosynthesis integral membrane protein MurJ [Egicoccus halophilus]GGI04745.1 lipid II flippase MurJ [Egicoccus halophilus]
MSEPSGDASGNDLRRSSALVGAGILLSRVAGLVRESATAAFLGTGIGAEALRAALRIPNLMQNLLGEGVLSASFIPAYSKLLAEGRREDAGRLAGAIAGLLLLVTSVLVVVGVVFAGPITRVITPGWPEGSARFELTVTLVRILTPGVGLLVLSAWCLGVLNSHRRFFLSYVAPVAWNAAIIVLLVSVGLSTSEQFTVAQAFAWGAVLGSALQFGVQLPGVLRLTRGLRLSTSLAVPGVRAVVSRFGQVVAGRGGVQLAAYVDVVVASLLAGGALAALGYAQVLYLLPISLFGMAIAAAELPTLSTLDHEDRRRVVERIDTGLGRVAFFVVPSTVAFVLVGDLVVATVYQRGNFSEDASVQVGAILAVYGLGLLASTSSRLLQSSLYGVGDTRTPAIYAVLRVVVSLLVGIAVMFPLDAVQATSQGISVVGDVAWQVAPEALRAADAPNALRLGGAGLAFGAAVGAWFEWLLLRTRVRIVFGPTRLGGPHARRIVLAALAAAVAALAARALVETIDLHATIEGLLALGLVGSVYVLVARAVGVPEARELTGRLERLVDRRAK